MVALGTLAAAACASWLARRASEWATRGDGAGPASKLAAALRSRAGKTLGVAASGIVQPAGGAVQLTTASHAPLRSTTACRPRTRAAKRPWAGRAVAAGATRRSCVGRLRAAAGL